MARIDDYILNCVIYLYPDAKCALESSPSGGSGFIVGVQSNVEKGFYYTYAVTNAHIIHGGCSAIRINKRDGTFDILEIKPSEWTTHPDADDVAIVHISLDSATHNTDFFINEEQFLTKKEMVKLDIGIGDDSFLVGRFQKASGIIQNTPTIRTGIIAQMPREPIVTPYGLKQESFLVECQSISGFSGSPVFVRIEPYTRRPNQSVISTMWRRRLLGIDWGHLNITEKISAWSDIKGGWHNDETLRVTANSAMTGVVPCWKLNELLYQEKFVKQREEFDKERSTIKTPEPDLTTTSLVVIK